MDRLNEGVALEYPLTYVRYFMVATKEEGKKKPLSKKELIRMIAETDIPKDVGDFNYTSLERTNIANLQVIYNLISR